MKKLIAICARRRHGVARIATAVVAVYGMATARAAEWIFEPSIDLASMYDDNVELATGPHTSSSGYILAPRLSLNRNTETSRMDLDAYAAFTDYQRGDVEDRTESAASLRSYNQTSERGTLGLDAELRRDTLFERFSEARGVGDLRDVDIGLSTSTRVRRTYVAASPYFDWKLTERSAMRVGYRLTDVSFSNSEGTGLFDYKEHLISGSYTREITEKDSVSVSANVIRFRPEDATSEADTVQLLAGLSRKFSEATRGGVAAGVSRTKQTEAGTEDSTSGVVLRAEMEQKSEISQLETVLSRDVAPSGIGRTLSTDQFRIRWLRKTAPTVDFVLEAQAIRTKVLEGDDPTIDRRYLEIGPSFRWHWLEDWAISGGYRYRRQKYDAESDSADSNAVFLGVSYAL